MSSAVTKAAPLSSKRKKDDDDDDEHDDDNDKPVVIGDGNEEASLESDDDEDDEQQQQAPRQDGKQGAQGDFAKLGRLFERQRVDFAKTFTKDCMTVEQVDASRFAQHGVKPSTQCAACDDAIMGNCTNVYVFMHRGGSAVRYFHPDCFCCTHHDQDKQCGASPFVQGDDAGKKKNVCYVSERSDVAMPVCARHVTHGRLEFPRFAADDGEKIRDFFDRYGFVVIRSGVTDEFCAQGVEWVSSALAVFGGWTNEQRKEYLAEPGADWRLSHVPGIKEGYIGLTGTAPNSTKLYSAALLQSKQAWDIRKAAFPATLSLFPPIGSVPPTKKKARAKNSEKALAVNAAAGMCPVLALMKGSELQTSQVRAFGADKRHTQERVDVNSNGRATAMRIFNGIFFFTKCTTLGVLVCPQAWETADGSKVCTFREEWNRCQGRAFAGGIFPANHPVGDYMTNIHVEPGDVFLLKDSRPYVLAPDPDRNVFGMVINAQDSLPKEITMKNRAAAVTGQYVAAKSSSLMGYRYLAHHAKVSGSTSHASKSAAATADALPDDFGDVAIPLTMHSVLEYAREVFGTDHVERPRWPAEYRDLGLGKKMSSGDELDEGQTAIRSIPPAAAKAKAKAKAPAPAKPATATTAKKRLEREERNDDDDNDAEAAAAAAAEAMALAEEEDRDVDRVVDDDAGESAPKPLKPPAKSKGKGATSTSAAAAAADSSPFGNPCKDMKLAVEAANDGQLPDVLRFNNAWLANADDAECINKWCTLLPDKSPLAESMYNGDRFAHGAVFASSGVRIELFDAFEDARIDTSTEQALRDVLAEMATRKRKDMIIASKPVKEARVVNVYGQGIKYGNDKLAPAEETPDFVEELFKCVASIPRPTLPNEGETEVRETSVPNRLVLVCVSKKGEHINPIAHLDLVEDSDVFVMCLGGLGKTRKLRIRLLGDKKEGQKAKPKGTILVDLGIYSGTGILLPSDFFSFASFEVLKVPGPKETESEATAPFALAIFSTAVNSTKRRKKTSGGGGGGGGKAAAAARHEEALASLAPLREQLQRLIKEHEGRIAKDEALKVMKEEAMRSLKSANKGSAAGVRELQSATADLYQALTGLEYEPPDEPNSDADVPAPVAPVAVAPRKAPPASSGGASSAAKKTGTAAAKRPRATDGDDDDDDDHDDRKPAAADTVKVPSETRKAVITGDGKVAVRSTREVKRPVNSKADVIREQHETMLYKAYEKAEKAREARAARQHLPYTRRSFKEYCSSVERKGKNATLKSKDAEFHDAMDAEEDGGFEDADDEDFGSEDSSSSGGSGDGSSESSGSGDVHVSEAENPKVDAAERAALQLDALQLEIDALYRNNERLLEGPKANKELEQLYVSVGAALDKALANKKPDPTKVTVLAERFKLLEDAVAAHHDAKAAARKSSVVPSRKRPTPAPAAEAEARDEDKAVVVPAAAAGLKIVAEGFNPGVDASLTADLLTSLIDISLALLDIAHCLPHTWSTTQLEKMLHIIRRNLEAFGDKTKPVKSRINAKTLATWCDVNRMLFKFLASVKVAAETPVAPKRGPMTAVFADVQPTVAAEPAKAVVSAPTKEIEAADQSDPVEADDAAKEAADDAGYVDSADGAEAQVAADQSDPMEESDGEDADAVVEREEPSGEVAAAAAAFDAKEAEEPSASPEPEEIPLPKSKAPAAPARAESLATVVASKPEVNGTSSIYVFLYKTDTAGAIIVKWDTTEEGARKKAEEYFVGLDADERPQYEIRALPSDWRAKLQKLNQKAEPAALPGKKASIFWSNMQ